MKVLAATRLGNKLVTGQYEGYRKEDGVDARLTKHLPTLLVTSILITGDGKVFPSTS